MSDSGPETRMLLILHMRNETGYKRGEKLSHNCKKIVEAVL